MTTRSQLQQSPGSKEDLGERLAGTSQTPAKEGVNQNQTTLSSSSSSSSSSKTMSPSVGAPLAVGADKAHSIGRSTGDTLAASTGESGSTMKPFHTTNSTLPEEDYNENEEQEEIGDENERDLETSGTEESKQSTKNKNNKLVSANSDSNEEAQENKLNLIVADPPEQLTSLNNQTIMSSKSDHMDESNEPDLVDFVDSDDEQQQQLSRRLFLQSKHKPNSVAGEIKKLKNQGSRLLLSSKNPLKRKRSKKKNLNKPMRPRLGTTTVDYGNMISAYQTNNNNNIINQEGSPASSASTTNAISNSIRQHFPAVLANPTQQLSTTVQKYIMSKLSPSASNQQTQTISSAGMQSGKRPAIIQHQLHTSAQQLVGPSQVGSSAYQQQQQQQAPASYLENARLVEALTQLAAGSTSGDDSSPMAFASSKPHLQTLPSQQGNKMIPIEIIGLDPSVTNSILQSYDSDQAGPPPPLTDPMQMYPGQHEPALYHHQDSSNQQVLAHQQLQQLQGAVKGADGLPKSTFPRASSILHIHHFHTQPPNKAAAVLQAGSQETNDQQVGGDPGRAPSPQQQVPPQRLIAASTSGKGGQQKVYINDKGQVVYLSVEDQTEAKNGEQQQQDGSGSVVEQQQQVVASDGHETRPGNVDAGSQLAEQQQQQEYQQAQQEYTQQVEADQQQHHLLTGGDASGSGAGNQQEPQQVETINLASDQPISIKPSGSGFKSLLNPVGYGGQQSIYSMAARNFTKPGDLGRQPRVYLTSNGQTISLIGGRANEGMAAAGGPVESEADRQQFLMVAYKPQPQQQFRNVTEDHLFGGHRNPYSEGQESKPSFIATNHLLAGAPQLLKGGSLVLRPFAGRFGSGQQQQVFMNSSGGNTLEDFNYELARLRNQQQSMSLSDLMARLNGTLPIGADLSHLDALRTGNKSLLLHGMFNSLASSSSSLPASTYPKPTSAASLPVESIPLTIVPIHQAANMSGYQLGGGASQQVGHLRLPPLPSPQENRVPFQAAAAAASTNPAALKALMADLTNTNTNNNNNNNPLHSAALLLAAAANNNNQSRPSVELASVQSSWMLPDAMDSKLTGAASLQSNGYNNGNGNNSKALAALMALRNNGTLLGPLQPPTVANPATSQIIENLTFLKHLREMKERLKLANSLAEPSSVPPPPPLISHHHLLSLNSTNKLSSDDLLSLLNEQLRLSSNNSSTINLGGQMQTFSADANHLQSLEPARSSKFGQPQSSSPAQTIVQAPFPLFPSNSNLNKHIRSKINNNSSNSHLGDNSEHRNQQQKVTANGQPQSIGNNKDHRTAMESQQSDVSVDRPMPMPPSPNYVHHDKHHHQVVSQVMSADDSADFVSDTNGLGTIALAFIFISLITLTLLAASMIYRHKRRSVARCADLPSRSRLNLTQRTKHFVRSNFVNPGDVSSIKSVNGLNSSGGSSSSPRSIHKRSLTSPSGKMNHLAGQKSSAESCELRIRSPATVNSARTGGSENTYLAKKTFGQVSSLSTFNTTPQLVAAAAAAGSVDHRYHFSSNSSKQSSETVRTDNNSATTDIKTLNTRLQKPPHLKSLISTPDCLLWNKRQHLAHSNAGSSNRGGDCDHLADANNFNDIRMRPGNGQVGSSSARQMMSAADAATCKLSPSSRKGGNEGGHLFQESNRHHQYGSPLKELGGRLQVAADSSKSQQAYSNKTSRPSTTMSTIHSIRDAADSKSGGSSSPPSQIKRQVNIIGRMGGKLNHNHNLPAPKHLVASAASTQDEREKSGSNQIDRL